MTGFKEIMSIAGVRSCMMVDRDRLPMKLLFNDKEYILKATHKNGLIMVKNESIDDRPDETKDPRDIDK
jgi:hypothetical protein